MTTSTSIHMSDGAAACQSVSQSVSSLSSAVVQRGRLERRRADEESRRSSSGPLPLLSCLPLAQPHHPTHRRQAAWRVSGDDQLHLTDG